MNDEKIKKEKPCKYCDPDNPKEFDLWSDEYSEGLFVDANKKLLVLNLGSDEIDIFYCPFCGRKL